MKMAGQKIKDWPDNERPRERLLKYGAESSGCPTPRDNPEDRKRWEGVLNLSLSLLDMFKALRSIDASPAEISSTKRLGIAKIAQIKAAFELGKRLMGESSVGKQVFASIGAVYTYFAPRFKNLKKELFLSLLLDTKNRLIREYRLSEGTLTNSPILPREAFKEAIRESAASVMVVHNHPSSDPAPSRDDVTVTERLKSAGEIIGITVLDHVIICDGIYIGLKEKGIL